MTTADERQLARHEAAHRAKREAERAATPRQALALYHETMRALRAGDWSTAHRTFGHATAEHWDAYRGPSGVPLLAHRILESASTRTRAALHNFVLHNS